MLMLLKFRYVEIKYAEINNLINEFVTIKNAISLPNGSF